MESAVPSLPVSPVASFTLGFSEPPLPKSPRLSRSPRSSGSSASCGGRSQGLSSGAGSASPCSRGPAGLCSSYTGTAGAACSGDLTSTASHLDFSASLEEVGQVLEVQGPRSSSADTTLAALHNPGTVLSILRNFDDPAQLAVACATSQAFAEAGRVDELWHRVYAAKAQSSAAPRAPDWTGSYRSQLARRAGLQCLPPFAALHPAQLGASTVNGSFAVSSTSCTSHSNVSGYALAFDPDSGSLATFDHFAQAVTFMPGEQGQGGMGMSMPRSMRSPCSSSAMGMASKSALASGDLHRCPSTCSITSAAVAAPPCSQRMGMPAGPITVHVQQQPGSPTGASRKAHQGMHVLAALPCSRAVTGHVDGGIRVWCMRTGGLLASTAGHRHSHGSSLQTLSADGHTVVSCCDEGARVWRLGAASGEDAASGRGCRDGAAAAAAAAAAACAGGSGGGAGMAAPGGMDADDVISSDDNSAGDYRDQDSRESRDGANGDDRSDDDHTDINIAGACIATDSSSSGGGGSSNRVVFSGAAPSAAAASSDDDGQNFGEHSLQLVTLFKPKVAFGCKQVAVSERLAACALLSLETVEVHSTADGRWLHSLTNRANASVAFEGDLLVMVTTNPPFFSAAFSHFELEVTLCDGAHGWRTVKLVAPSMSLSTLSGLCAQPSNAAPAVAAAAAGAAGLAWDVPPCICFTEDLLLVKCFQFPVLSSAPQPAATAGPRGGGAGGQQLRLQQQASRALFPGIFAFKWKELLEAAGMQQQDPSSTAMSDGLANGSGAASAAAAGEAAGVLQGAPSHQQQQQQLLLLLQPAELMDGPGAAAAPDVVAIAAAAVAAAAEAAAAHAGAPGAVAEDAVAAAAAAGAGAALAAALQRPRAAHPPVVHPTLLWPSRRVSSTYPPDGSARCAGSRDGAAVAAAAGTAAAAATAATAYASSSGGAGPGSAAAEKQETSGFGSSNSTGAAGADAPGYSPACLPPTLALVATPKRLLMSTVHGEVLQLEIPYL